MDTFSFSVTSRDPGSRARTGVIHTPHGDIETPAFVPVGTQATVKSLSPDDLTAVGTRLFFVNTYHAYLRPGMEIIRHAGGLHRFMHWDRALITDSGGFQIFSLARKKFVNAALSESAVLDRERFTRKLSRKDGEKASIFPDDYRPVGELVKIDDDGVTFTSHWDGSPHRFTPENSIGIQRTLGSDIMIAFDECAPYPTTHEYARAAMERTHRWAERCLDERDKSADAQPYQALYGVIQGGVYRDLRTESAKFISKLPFDGIAVGGVSVGESKPEMLAVLEWISPHLPETLPRHLLGVGEIDDMFTLIGQGIDTFDCVQPTRLARMGRLYVRDRTQREFQIDISKTMYADDMNPPDPECGCYTCRNFSLSYLHHLFRVRELLSYRLATIHNIYFMHSLVAEIRESIRNGRYEEIRKQYSA